MNKSIVLALLALLAMPIASAHVTLYLDPQDSSVPNGYCNTTYVRVMANITSPDDLFGTQFAIYHDQSCANITNLQWGPSILTMMSSWNAGTICPGYNYDWVACIFTSAQTGVVEICNLTVHCNCSTCGYCISPLNFSCGISGCAPYCPIQILNGTNVDLHLIPGKTTLENGTLDCGTTPSAETFSRGGCSTVEGSVFKSGTTPSAETFSKTLYEGWNLLSLPLTPEDDGASAVLSGVSYDAVYRYNATSKQFESADVMDPGTGYFVHATVDCTWTYSGTASTSMDASLEQGLNMVGRLNCSKDVSDTLSSISGKYYYVARWDTQAQKFEVYNPAAPPTFNDFITMDRGTGYFISAKQECVLSENC